MDRGDAISPHVISTYTLEVLSVTRKNEAFNV